MQQYSALGIDVHVQTGGADWAAAPLAEYYKLRRAADVHPLMDHLARNRASACVEALVNRGVDAERLSVSFRGLAGHPCVEFRPRPPRLSRLGEPRSGLEYIGTHFTVRPPELLGSTQDVPIRLVKATGDIKLLICSQHAGPTHWSHFLTAPPGLTLSVRHTALDTLITEGVVAANTNSCFVVGSASPRQLFCMEHYTLGLKGGKYFVQDSSSLLMHAGLQEVFMRVTWATRLVRCYIASADRDRWQELQAKEAHARISAFMQTHTVQFNGAGDEQLPHITQAWSIAHTDEAQLHANRETIAGVAAILREYPGLKITVRGETGAASSAPRHLADYFGLHYKQDFQDIMDQLARRRAQACLDALVAMGVTESQLKVAFQGCGERTKVEFVPEDADVNRGTEMRPSSAVAESKQVASPLPPGIPFELRLATGGSVIMAGITTEAEPEVCCNSVQARRRHGARPRRA